MNDPIPEFIRTHTTQAQAPLVPEITLHLATEITPIWQASEAWLHQSGLAPPFWAFAWPGSQAIARHILDTPTLAANRRVLDFASGCGLAAIAAAHAGAASVEAAEIDPIAREAIRLNAATNNVTLTIPETDLVGAPCRWDLILCGDVCYEAPMTQRILPWLRTMAAHAEIWIADPGRNYAPTAGTHRLATYRVPTSRELEDHTERTTHLLRLEP